MFNLKEGKGTTAGLSITRLPRGGLWALLLLLAMVALSGFYRLQAAKDSQLDTVYYKFSDHIDSIEWIDSLPKGLLSERIDTRYNTVTITPLADGYQIYVGPKDMESGGDGLLVTLDKAYQLTGYEIERIEPFPF